MPAGRAGGRTRCACRRSTRRARRRPARRTGVVGADVDGPRLGVAAHPFGNRTSAIASSSAISVSVPIGLSILVWYRHDVPLLDSGGIAVRVGPRPAHRWCSAYERHGRQRSAASDDRGRAGRAPCFDAEVGGQEHVRVAEPAHQHVVGGPRSDAGHVEQRAAHVVAVGSDVERDLAQRGPAPRAR